MNNISNFEDIISIEYTGTISMFVKNKVIYLPITAYEILNTMKKIPGFGINKKHKSYNDETIINNNNTYSEYIKHVFIAGLTPLQFFEETLLHETVHLCGGNGGGPLEEGFTELKTRELALKYNLKTSACGYPKEVKIAYQIQMIFGKEVVDKIAFAKNKTEIFELLFLTHGENAVEFYINLSREMKKEFDTYYKKKYPGLTGPFNKTKEYEKINYNNIYKIIENYAILKEETRSFVSDKSTNQNNKSK